MLLCAPTCFAQHEGDVGLVIQDSQLQTAVIADGQYISGDRFLPLLLETAGLTSSPRIQAGMRPQELSPLGQRSIGLLLPG